MSKDQNYPSNPYLFGDVEMTIYRTKDAWGEISVIERPGSIRVLTFDATYVQSSMDLQKPYVLVHDYTRAMILVLGFIKPKHVTFLGLGGGCLLRSLYHVFPECASHIVELRHEVYEVAKDFFKIPMGNMIKVSIADAKSVLKNTTEASTDIIFADLYNASGMSAMQMQRYFIKHCDRILSTNGWLVVNYHQMPKLNSFFFKCLMRHFSDVFLCATSGGNYILFASKSKIADLQKFNDAVVELERTLESSLIYLFRQFERLSGN